MPQDDRHFTRSTLRERIVEHVFVGDVLRTLWRRGVTDLEILRPEFDAHGYDAIMSRMHRLDRSQQGNSGTRPFHVVRCRPRTTAARCFAIPKSQKGNSQCRRRSAVRKNNHVLPPSAFAKVKTLDEIVVRLFGELPGA
jgi:hypothetical protein